MGNTIYNVNIERITMGEINAEKAKEIAERRAKELGGIWHVYKYSDERFQNKVYMIQKSQYEEPKENADLIHTAYPNVVG